MINKQERKGLYNKNIVKNRSRVRQDQKERYDELYSENDRTDEGVSRQGGRVRGKHERKEG
ncbi:hypothetical protein J25TS5_46210 [Paenibacillus faecis]|nr:hypothetical protein J25TS5_46210 [Paenibacillus faecis]